MRKHSAYKRDFVAKGNYEGVGCIYRAALWCNYMCNQVASVMVNKHTYVNVISDYITPHNIQEVTISNSSIRYIIKVVIFVYKYICKYRGNKQYLYHEYNIPILFVQLTYTCMSTHVCTRICEGITGNQMNQPPFLHQASGRWYMVHLSIGPPPSAHPTSKTKEFFIHNKKLIILSLMCLLCFNKSWNQLHWNSNYQTVVYVFSWKDNAFLSSGLLQVYIATLSSRVDIWPLEQRQLAYLSCPWEWYQAVTDASGDYVIKWAGCATPLLPYSFINRPH